MAERLMIVTDSTADLPARVIKDHDITVVPLNVHFGEEVLKRLQEIIPTMFKSEEQFTSIVGPIVGVHAGPGSIGVMAVPVS